jgi:hypothetical protein
MEKKKGHFIGEIILLIFIKTIGVLVPEACREVAAKASVIDI